MLQSVRLVSVAHGTRFGPGNQVAIDLTRAAEMVLGTPATAAYVELCAPLLPSVLEIAGPAVVVPLLLSTGYHVRHDLPAMVANAPDPAALALGAPLGPHPLLARAQAARLREAGATPGQPVVLVAAGSRDPAAVADLDAAVTMLAQEWDGPVRLATLSGPGSRPAEVVTPDDAVSPYLLAPGHFSDRARRESSGAAAIGAVMGAHEAVVDLMVARALELTARLRAARRAVA